MDEQPEGAAEQYQLPVGVGETLRLAREAKGWTLAQVAAETRITQRHLALIEAGDFAALPGRTYAVGFSRTYAKMLGLDESEVAQAVREELGRIEPRDTRAMSFEPGDPARVPSARLAWFSALAALILFIGGGAFVWTNYIDPEVSLPWLTGGEAPKPKPAPKPAAPAVPAANGAVVFTALEPKVWVKFIDGAGNQLMQGEMLQGESYTVPAEAVGVTVSTARPTALSITVGGQPVPPLADKDKVMSKVPATAAALLARPAPSATPSPAPSATHRATRPAAGQSGVPASEAAPAAPAAAAPAPAVSPTA
ncbi:MAG: helix-turn-helix domain-containing protein [Novosphingobium sp.]|nr:helix-turn-helix domain-containing protein [Novosphingobium sp.]